jgi:hypothetical protein
VGRDRRQAARRRATALVFAGAIAGFAPAARAKDLGKIDGAPARLDVTETAFLNWHGDNLNSQRRIDDDYAEWINRLNLLFAWKAWQVGLRLDTAKYWGAPTLAEFEDPANGYSGAQIRDARRQLPYRYRDTFLVQGNLSPSPNDPSVWPSKIWVSYVKPKLELTVGDAYVAFGRGFVLNIRKFDEIGADTTLQGGKAVARLDPITLTIVAGLTNPTRVDDATGFKLQDAPLLPGQTYRPSWSRDLVSGARVEGRVRTTTLGLHGSLIRRRDDLFTDDPTFVRDIQSIGANLSNPRISERVPLNVYGEVAAQRRIPFVERGEPESAGYAAYLATSLTTGIVTTSFEGKHYRAFNPVRLNADRSRYVAFQAVQYTANPTVELITQDSLFDNSCTTGGRGRVDVKATAQYTLFGSVGRFANWQQQCGAAPTLGINDRLDVVDRHDITDLYAGFDLRSAVDSSYLTITMGTRRETKASGESYYREGWIMATGSKTLRAPYSIEVDAWHRNRYQNLELWREGQTYVSFKHASDWALIFGHEYSTRPSQINPDPSYQGSDVLRALRFLPADGVQHFLNIGGQIRFGDAVILRLLLGEQRAALKCVSGVCRFFPAFAGFRSELVVRY